MNIPAYTPEQIREALYEMSKARERNPLQTDLQRQIKDVRDKEYKRLMEMTLYTKDQINRILGDDVLERMVNGGLLMDDHLDSLRSQAMIATTPDGLPNAVVTYIQALERTVLDGKYREREAGLKRVAFKIKEEAPDTSSRAY